MINARNVECIMCKSSWIAVKQKCGIFLLEWKNKVIKLYS
jgi:formate dehydrogenase maturation protein FdhE